MEPTTMLIGGAVAGAAALGYSLLTGPKKGSIAHGSARWPTRSELLKADMLRPESAPLEVGRWIIGPSPFGHGERLELTATQLLTGLMLIGPPGAGKSTNLKVNLSR